MPEKETGTEERALPRTRYLPFTVSEAVDLACEHTDTDTEDGVRRAADAVGAVIHARYRERWVRARAAADAGGDTLLEDLTDLLDSANYDELPHEVLEEALGESAVFAVQVQVDLDAFAELRFWRRGVHHSEQQVKRWWGLRTRTVRFEEYDRVAMYARYHDAEHYTDAGRSLEDVAFEPGTEHVKLFQNVPRPDLEMLLPGTKVSMRLIDKVFIGVPALIGGIVVAVTKLASAVGFLALLVAAYIGLRSQKPDISTGVLVTLFGAFAALGSYLWRQWSKYKSRKTEYLQSLSEGLYIRTLADGPGVLFTVLDAGEGEDVKEALLAYRALLDGPAPADEIDERVESWLHERCGDGVDFEVPDALQRLADLELASQDDGVWSPVPLEEAPQVMRDRWRELGDHLVDSTPTAERTSEIA